MDKTEIKKLGLKVTAPRLKVLKILESASDRHLSAEEIYKELQNSGDDVGLATVYRVLTQFEAAGLVIRHHFDEEKSVYELDDGEHHDHIVCVKCSKVVEFKDEIIEERQLEVAKKNNFKMTDHSLYIYGICGECH